jgi:hypothetical protein
MVGGGQQVMYTGRLIDELIATVERAELNAHIVRPQHPEPEEYLYLSLQENTPANSNLLGVA